MLLNETVCRKNSIKETSTDMRSIIQNKNVDVVIANSLHRSSSGLGENLWEEGKPVLVTNHRGIMKKGKRNRQCVEKSGT